MGWRDKTMVAALVLAIASLGFQLADAWPVLVSHLRPADWTVLGLVHAATLVSIFGLYARAFRGALLRPTEVLLTAFLIVVAFGADVSLMGKIGAR